MNESKLRRLPAFPITPAFLTLVLLGFTTMTSPDIRAGIALLIAALSASGESIIQNVEQIDRGYENIVDRLKSIGADIDRV